MDRSHAAPLLIAAFAILVLGVAAGSLNGAMPADTHEIGSSSSAGESEFSGGSASADSSSSSDQTVSHVLFSELNVGENVDGRSSGPGRSVGVFLLGGGLLLVGVVALAYHLTGNDDRATSKPDPDPEFEFADRKRGRTTATVTNAPLTNDVYRAWRTMAESVGANAVARTPAEVAHTATSAGLPARPVDELTELFRATRYGTADPTNDSEERARNALERILRVVQTDDPEATASDSDR